jgi:hypothetical protein
MKLAPIPGIVDKIFAVKPVKGGYTQTVIIKQEAQKNAQGYTLSKEQFFVIHIWSNKQDDSRFLKHDDPKFIGAPCIASVYLDGQRWQGRNGFEYNHKMNLDKWLTDEEFAKTNPTR